MHIQAQAKENQRANCNCNMSFNPVKMSHNNKVFVLPQTQRQFNINLYKKRGSVTYLKSRYRQTPTVTNKHSPRRSVSVALISCNSLKNLAIFDFKKKLTLHIFNIFNALCHVNLFDYQSFSSFKFFLSE